MSLLNSGLKFLKLSYNIISEVLSQEYSLTSFSNKFSIDFDCVRKTHYLKIGKNNDSLKLILTECFFKVEYFYSSFLPVGQLFREILKILEILKISLFIFIYIACSMNTKVVMVI